MRHHLLLLGLFAAPMAAQAASCPAPASMPQPSPAVAAPLATELSFEPRPLGSPAGVLSQAYDSALSVDSVLLRRQLAACYEVANAAPAATGVSPDNPAAYKPKTQFDNTPWRFNMSQNGKKMTADEFAAWMESKGVHVAKGAPGAVVPAATPPLPPPPPANPPKP
jgi:hypothetical protein